jgi:hypothetical protein
MWIDGKGVRALVNALPGHVFDDLVAVCGADLFDGLSADDVKNYVHWEEFSEGYKEDDVAQAYGYDDLADMEGSGVFVLLFGSGMLIIE